MPEGSGSAEGTGGIVTSNAGEAQGEASGAGLGVGVWAKPCEKPQTTAVQMKDFNERISEIKSRNMVLGKPSPNSNLPVGSWIPQKSEANRGTVVFESGAGTQNGWRRKIVAGQPAEIWSGNLWEDWRTLEERVAAMRNDAGKNSTAFAAGTVDYDGRFEFAFYPREQGPNEQSEEQIEPVGAEEWGTFRPETGDEEFMEWVKRAQELIAAGDIYQVNLARRFSCEPAGDPWAFYQTLREVSPAPFGAFLQQQARTVISSSPECFLQMDEREVITRPIKGTRARIHSRQGDLAHQADLRGSAKEQAELLMITDLLRNDLGKVSAFGSVRVQRLAELESFSQVHHLVSTIRGELKTEVGHVEALHACFPGGSITGAPKKRAMEIIAGIEPFPRGLYTGAIGILRADGTSEFSIAIRTVIVEQGRAHFQVGAGIVADSAAERELAETNEKARGILLAAKAVREK